MRWNRGGRDTEPRAAAQWCPQRSQNPHAWGLCHPTLAGAPRPVTVPAGVCDLFLHISVLKAAALCPPVMFGGFSTFHGLNWQPFPEELCTLTVQTSLFLSALTECFSRFNPWLGGKRGSCAHPLSVSVETYLLENARLGWG